MIRNYKNQLKEKVTKKIKHVISFVIGIIVTTILTIFLAAYENQTNAWVQGLFTPEKKETYLEKMKRLAESGDLPEYNCGSLGSIYTEVVNKCGEPVYRTQHFDKLFVRNSLGYANEKKGIWLLDFENQKLKRIYINNPQNTNIAVRDLKKVFGTPTNTNEEETSTSSDTYYTYQLSTYELQFFYNREKGTLKSISLENTKKIPPLTEENDFLNKTHEVIVEKQLSPQGGIKAAQQIKQWVSKRDLGNYDCGPLGTSFEQVKLQCGKDFGYIFDNQLKEKKITYLYKDREVKIGFYKEELTSLSITELEKPLNITRKQIEQVFGKPDRVKSDRKILSDIKFLEYQQGQITVSFFFNEKGYCHYIWLRKSDMYDSSYGQLLPKYSQGK